MSSFGSVHETPPGWLDILLECTANVSYVVCVDIDGILEDTSLLLVGRPMESFNYIPT